jgi:3-hydroxyacyl-CoA dehydrogenase/enoyl-CoA hydratase/3-hydroxybutyryl-CoA epimerase
MPCSVPTLDFSDRGLADGVTRSQDSVGPYPSLACGQDGLAGDRRGEKTSDVTLAKAVDAQIQDPIVVNDSRGFFTSRVIGKFLDEAIAMVGEGIPAASVEQAALQAGYPAGPLQLFDELTLTLPRKIREETKAAAIAEGRGWVEHGSRPWWIG